MAMSLSTKLLTHFLQLYICNQNVKGKSNKSTDTFRLGLMARSLPPQCKTTTSGTFLCVPVLLGQILGTQTTRSRHRNLSKVAINVHVCQVANFLTSSRYTKLLPMKRARTAIIKIVQQNTRLPLITCAVLILYQCPT